MRNIKTKLISFLAALAVTATALALPPYGVHQDFVDPSGDYFWGYYLVPPTPSNRYLWGYDGAVNIPSENPLKFVAIGTGLAYDGTTLSATGGNGTVTSVSCGTGLSGGTITTTGSCSLPNTGTSSTYSGVTTDAQGRVTAGTTRSFNYTTRSLNTCFQASASRDVQVSYAVDIATSLSLTTGQQGTVYLRIYTNSGCSTGTQEINRFVNGQTGTLTIGLALTQNVTGNLSGIIPAGMYAQLVTENNVGTPTFTARPGQEVLL